MFRKIILFLFTISSINLSAEVKGITWLENNPETNESSDILDVINPASEKSIDQNYEDEDEIGRTPFPEAPLIEPATITNPFQLKSLNKLATPNYYTADQDLIPYKKIRKDYKSKIPTMAMQDVVSSKCHPYNLNKKLNSIKNDKNYIITLRNYFSKCDRKLVNNARNKYADLIKVAARKYKVLDNKNAHRFKLEFNNNESVEGYLALKPEKVRPLVIIKCGVFCNGRSSSTNNMITAALYDSGPFHVMMVANHTGPKNIRDNARVNFGGFMEGQELMHIAKWIKKESAFKNYVSEVHVLGISLGGHAALYAGIYNEHLDEKIIDSVIGFCPVVSIKDSVHDVTAKGLIGTVVSHVVKKLIRDNYDNIPELSNHFNRSKKADKKTMSARLFKANTDYVQSIDPASFMQPYTGLDIEDEIHFTKLGDYISQAKKISTPTLVWASKNDPVVLNKNNSARLQQAVPFPTEDKNIQVLNVKKGSHCAVFESYDWNTATTILNNFLIRNSKSLQKTKERKIASINFKQPKIKFGERYVSPRLLTFPNFNKVVVQYKIYRGPLLMKPFYAGDSSFRHETIEIPYDVLPFKVTAPTTTVEAQILTRWLNTNVHFMSDGKILTKSKKAPNQIEWTTY